MQMYFCRVIPWIYRFKRPGSTFTEDSLRKSFIWSLGGSRFQRNPSGGEIFRPSFTDRCVDLSSFWRPITSSISAFDESVIFSSSLVTSGCCFGLMTCWDHFSIAILIPFRPLKTASEGKDLRCLEAKTLALVLFKHWPSSKIHIIRAFLVPWDPHSFLLELQLRLL